MDTEERLDLNDRRLNDHAVRIAKLEESVSSVKEDTQEIKTAVGKIGSEMITAMLPTKLLTDSNSRAILTMEADLKWIKPWFKRSLAGVGATSLIGLIAGVFKYLSN